MIQDTVKLKRLKIGSNNFENFNTFIDINNNEPLVLASGEIPIVSINVSTPNGWIKLIDNNKSNSPSLQVEKNANKRCVLIKSKTIAIFEGHCLSDDYIEITKLDFRSLGINIYLKDDVFYIGNMQFTENNFKNVSTLFKLG